MVEQAAGTYTSASAAYDAWAAANGLSNSATVSSFNSDDGMTLLDLGFAPLLGSTETRIAVSGECAVQFFKSPVTNTGTSPYTAQAGGVLIGRMYGPSSPPPSVMFSVRPDSQDAGIGSTKWQKATNVAILFFKGGPYSNPTSTDVAMLIKPASIEIVITINTQESQKFSQLQFNQSDGNLVADAGIYLKNSLSGTTSYKAVGPITISGTVKDDVLAPAARTVRAYSRATGQLEAQTVSDASTGAYSLMVFGPGERTVICLDSGSTKNDLALRVNVS